MVENVLITTADGYTGYEIANQLVSNFRFKAKVKEIYATAENVNECKELEKKGVHVFQFDSSDNFNDKIKADIVVLIPPTKEDKVHRSQNLIKACESAGIKNCVLISTATTDIADPKEQPHIAHFLEIEKAAKHASFEQLVIMRANFYTENILLYKEQMKKGKLPIPINNGKFAPAALKDVSEAACVMLAHPEKLKEYHGKPITLTGEEALSGHEMAERIGKVLGSKLEFENISNEEARKILSKVKQLDESERNLLIEFYDLVKANKTNFVEVDDFKALTGRSPTSLEDFVKTHKDELK